jgi:putative SOS response-associated peptidase YedK
MVVAEGKVVMASPSAGRILDPADGQCDLGGMCGKFTQMYSWAEIHEFSSLIRGSDGGGGEGGGGGNDGRETVTPMRAAHVIRLNAAGARETVPMRWGFIDRASPTPFARPKHMHARGETVDRLPTFAAAFAHRRGLVAVKTFNVGEEVTPKKTVQHVLTPGDGAPIGLSVIWEAVAGPDGGEPLTFVMVTTAPNGLIARVTDRMPAVILPEAWGTWLGENGATAAEANALLAPYAGELDMAPQAKPPPRPRGGNPHPQPPPLV